MKSTAKGMLKTLATRSVIAAIPVAMVTAYAGIGSVPMPPRMAEYAIQQVAEITVSPSTVGIAASPLYGQTKAQIDQQLDELQALGVENIRVFVPWGSIDFFGPSDPGSPSWATLDLVMQAAKERNLGVLAEINSTPPSGALNGTGSIFGTDTPDPAKYAAFLTKFVGAYGDEVSAYEIWNEPNSIQFSNPIDPAAYAALVKASYQAIKPLDPTATIVAGAVGHVFTTGATMDPVEFVNAMIAADPTIGQYFDALSYHPYDDNLPFSAGNVDPNSGGFASDTAFNQIKDLMALFPTKKVWLSEFGVPTYTYNQVNPFTGQIDTISITQQQQEDLIKNLVNTWSTLSQAGPVFLYTGRDTATGTPVADNNYGLFDQFGNPKQVVTDFLKQYYIDHPQNPTTTPPVDPPVDPPTDPAAALQAALQAFAQQIAQALATAFQQAFVNGLGQQIANAIVNAIATALAGLGAPAAPATSPLTLRMASVAAPAESGLAAEETVSKTAAVSATTGEEPAAAEAAATPGAKTVAAVEAPAAVEVAATTAATEVATPEVAKAPEATTPAATTPAVVKETEPAPAATAPVATAPAAAAPVATAPAVSAPAATSPSAPAATDATTPTKSDADTPAKAKDDGADKGAKGDDSAKPADAAKSAADKPGRPTRHGKFKGGLSATDVKSAPVTEKVTTSVGAGSAPSGSAATG